MQSTRGLAAAAVLSTAALVAAQQGPDLVLYSCTGAASAVQTFTFDAQNRFWLAATPAPHMCVDIEGFNTNPGAEVYTVRGVCAERRARTRRGASYREA